MRYVYTSVKYPDVRILFGHLFLDLQVHAGLFEETAAVDIKLLLGRLLDVFIVLVLHSSLRRVTDM